MLQFQGKDVLNTQANNWLNFDKDIQETNEKDKSEKKLKAVTTTTTKPKVIHFRIQQRNGKKSITIIEGLSTLDLSVVEFKALNRLVKNKFNTGSCIVDNVVYGKILQINGDFRIELTKLFKSDPTFAKVFENVLFKIHGV